MQGVKIKIENKGITTKFLPAGSVTDCGRVLEFTLPSGHEMHLYAFKEFDGYKISILPSEYQDYEYLYLMSNQKKIIKVSQFYHSNYLDLKKAIETKTRNLGEEPFSLFKELKEIFVA